MGSFKQKIEWITACLFSKMHLCIFVLLCKLKGFIALEGPFKTPAGVWTAVILVPSVSSHPLHMPRGTIWTNENNTILGAKAHYRCCMRTCLISAICVLIQLLIQYLPLKRQKIMHYKVSYFFREYLLQTKLFLACVLLTVQTSQS